jgi:hypothetical protein
VRAVLGGVRPRRAALAALADPDQAARLEPAQRGQVLGGRAGQALQQLALLGGELAGHTRRLRVEERLRLAGRRRDDAQGTRGRGAVLLGHPPGELDEVARDGVVAHVRRRRQLLLGDLRRVGHGDHDAVELLVPERDAHDRPDIEAEAVRLVVEGTGQAAGGGERLDPGEH